MDNHLERIKNFLDSDSTEARISKVALSVVAIAGVIGITFLAAGIGNAIQVFSQFKRTKRYTSQQIKSVMDSLHKNKLIEYISDKNGVTKVRITTKGKVRLRSFAIDLIKIPKQKQWDGKWRLVMFDLPIRYTKARDSLRFKLKQLGFIQFQKSVWIHPYPCTDEILFISDYYKVHKYVEILEVSRILCEAKFKKAFEIK
jgi:DNA-binding transcriptional regulator PaaX